MLSTPIGGWFFLRPYRQRFISFSCRKEPVPFEIIRLSTRQPTQYSMRACLELVLTLIFMQIAWCRYFKQRFQLKRRSPLSGDHRPLLLKVYKVPIFTSTMSSSANDSSRSRPINFVIRLTYSRPHVLKSSAMIINQRPFISKATAHRIFLHSSNIALDGACLAHLTIDPDIDNLRK